MSFIQLAQQVHTADSFPFPSHRAVYHRFVPTDSLWTPLLLFQHGHRRYDGRVRIQRQTLDPRLDEKMGELRIVPRCLGRRIAFHIMDHKTELSRESHGRHQAISYHQCEKPDEYHR
jgi:hypothetical protein